MNKALLKNIRTRTIEMQINELDSTIRIVQYSGNETIYLGFTAVSNQE